MTSWPTPAPDALDDHSYYLEGDASVAQNPTWSSLTPTAKDVIYTVDSIDASYFSAGTLTSQIYDTALSSPAYGTLAWQIAKNNYGNYGGGGLGADLIIKFRTNSDKDALKASSDWSAALSIDTLSAVTGSASISAAGGGRYCQFQASFISQPTPGKFDYTKSCVLKNLAISWPGQERIVDVSGYFTRRPNYGIFSVGIDGHQLTKGIEVKLEASEKFSSAKTITRTLTVEAEPRNTGK
jgi:hypothetical protein